MFLSAVLSGELRSQNQNTFPFSLSSAPLSSCLCRDRLIHHAHTPTPADRGRLAHKNVIPGIAWSIIEAPTQKDHTRNIILI